MASRPWRSHQYPNRRYDTRRGREPGPWQDGYSDNYSGAYVDGNWGTHAGYQQGYDYPVDAGYAHGGRWDSYGAQDYGHASSSGQHYQREAYDGRYEEPYYSESYSRGYDTSYRGPSHGYEDAQMAYAQQGFEAGWSRRPEPSTSFPHSQTRHLHHSHRTMDDGRAGSPERRIQTPPQPAPHEPPRLPSPEYLKLANEEPKHLDTCHDARKLLILDLNGTLVFRSAYRPKNKHMHPPPNVSTPAAGDLGGTGSGATSGPPLPRLRTAHPRPYLPSFRSYLFAPETQAWLDVMIWSSAQPHSVQGMVERVFGAEAYAEGIANNSLGSAAIGVVKRMAGEDVASVVMDGTAQDKDAERKGERDGSGPRLVAIWARDTLGLSDSHYFQKVQTVKDLNIPWSKLSNTPTRPAEVPVTQDSSLPVSIPTLSERLRSPPPPLRSSPLASPLSRPSTPPGTSPPTSSSVNSPSKDDTSTPSSAVSKPYTHSALSTLLLDDSPLKAILQPYNHVCIPEYDVKKRASDLAAFMREKTRETTSEEMREKTKMELEEVKRSVALTDNPIPVPETTDIMDAAGADNAVRDSTPGATAEEDEDSPRKRKRQAKKSKRREDKIAKAGDINPEVHAEEEKEEFDPTLLAVIGVLDEIKIQRNVAAWIRAGALWGPGREEGIAPAPDSENDATSCDQVQIRGYQSDVEAAQSDNHTDETTGTGLVSNATIQDDGGRDATTRKRAKHHGDNFDPNDASRLASDDLSKDSESSLPGNDQTSGNPKSTADATDDAGKVQPMWFEDSATLRYWVRRGKRALEELGLPIDHGIER